MFSERRVSPTQCREVRERLGLAVLGREMLCCLRLRLRLRQRRQATSCLNLTSLQPKFPPPPSSS